MEAGEKEVGSSSRCLDCIQLSFVSMYRKLLKRQSIFLKSFIRDGKGSYLASFEELN